jgi:hypothetical protein
VCTTSTSRWKRDLAELEARLVWKIAVINAGVILILTGIFAAIVRWILR